MRPFLCLGDKILEVTGIEVRIAQARQAAADADRLDKSLDRLGRSGTKAEGGFERLRRSLFSLQGAFGALGVGLTARELINFADASTNVANRLRLVTTSAQELVQVQDRLFRIAQDTRSAFQGTVDLYGTLARNAGELSLQQSQLFDITELINKSIKSSGASAMAASAGLTQLSQALGSGVLRGDEFASVMEQLPSIARSLAAGLNVPIGALRGLAEQGELTAERVVNALLSQSDAIDAEYAKTTGTVADSFTRLQNAAIQSIGSINQNVGGTQILSMAMGGLADNLDTVLKLMATFAAAGLAGVMSKLTVNTLAAGRAFNVLAAAMARNPFGLIAVGISAAASALVLFKDEQFTFMGVTAELGDFTSSVWTEIKNAITLNMDEASEFAKSSFGEMASSAGISSTDIITSFSTAAGALPGLWKDSTNLQLAILVGFSQGVTSIAGSIVDSFKEAFSSIRNVATSFFSSLQDFFAGRDLTFGAFRSALNDSFVEPTIEAGQKARDAFTEAFQIDYIGELSGRAAETANSAISSINTSLDGFGERVAATARETKISRLQAQAFSEVMSGKLNPTAEKSNSIFEDLSGRLDKLGTSAKKATRELTAMEQAQKKFNDAIANYPARQVVRELEDQFAAQERLADSAIAKFEEMQSIRERGLQISKSTLPEAEQRQIKEAELQFLFDKGAFGEGQQAVDTLNRAIDQLNENTRKTSDVAKDLGFTFESAFERMILQGAKFSDTLKGIAKDILAITLRTNITAPLAKSIGDLDFGNIFSSIFAPTAHQGGIIGTDAMPGRQVPALAFADAPRYHAGGIAGFRPDEQPAVLKRGEEVLTESNPRHRNNQNSQNNNVQIQIIDQRSADSPPVQVTQSQGPNGMQQFKVLIVETLKQSMGTGELDRTFANNFGLRRPGVSR